MPTLNVTVLNKIATGDKQIIVCDNTDYIVHFELDAEWNDYNAKTMRILYTDNTYDDIVFTGTDCALPRIYNAQSIRIGIYAGDLHATAAAVYECKRSVLSEEGQHVEPTEDVYNQIMDAINSGMLKGETGNGIASISKTATSGNVDTYTILFTDGTETTYDVTNGAVTSVDGLTGDVELDYKANIDGYYDGLTAGTADQLLSDKTIIDNAPYVNRQSGGGNHVGDRKEIKEIVGASIVWNQLVLNGDFSDGSTGWTARQTGGFSVVSGEGVLAVTGNNNNNTIYSGVSAISGHKYLVRAKLYIDADSSIKTARIALSNNYTEDAVNAVNVTTTKTEYAAILTPAGTPNRLTINVRSSGTLTVGDKLYIDDVTVIDLTALFGSAIADRAYTLEQATAGSGVAWLKSYGFFTKSYYAYTAAASLASVKTSAHETQGQSASDKHTYALDDDLTLNGLFKLDANNEIYADGDIYEEDGTVTRNYQKRGYVSGDEELANAITDGTNTIVKLTTVTTETADAYQQVMVVYPDGTEKWIDAEYEAGNRDFEMPVGHSTEYHVDLKAKLEDLPDSPNSDGDYLLRRRNGVNSYVRFVSELPAEPTEDGVYTLTATVSGGVATYSWEA